MTFSKSLIVQVAMVALSVAIIITYVQPAFNKIGEMQDDIVVYQKEQEKVSEVNAQLSSLVNTLNNISSDDQRRLLTYMPDEVDTISVVRDLSLISEEANVVYVSAISTGAGVPVSERDAEVENSLIAPREYKFNLSIEGAYEQIKTLFTLIEQNDYLMQIENVSVQQTDGVLLDVSIDLSVFAHAENITGEELVL
jgi:hypothetical protein